MKKVDEAKIIEQLAEAMPYLYRIMKENRGKIHNSAGLPNELEKQVIMLMSLAFSLGVGFDFANKKTN